MGPVPSRRVGPAPSRLRDEVRFCVLFTVYTVAAFAVLYAGQHDVVEPLNRHLARVARWALHGAGVAAASTGAVVTVPGFAVEIKNNCNAIYEIGLYAAAVWAYPAPLRERLVGTAVGVGVLYLVNLLRILALIALGVYAREWFDTAHLYGWQLVFLAVVAVCWLSWVLRVRRLA
jgi:exosortase H (IPTLxxWG-CTERM-specific)